MSAEPAPGRLSDGDLDRIARRRQLADEPAPTPEDVVADALAPDAFPDDGTPFGEGPAETPWKIDDHGAAEWALAKVRQTHARHYDEVAPTLTAIEALEAEAQRLRDWVADRERQRDERCAFFETHLTDYLRRIREQEAADGVPEGKRTKSLSLSGGRVKSRAGSRTAVLEDEEAIVAWVEERDLDEPFAERVPKVDRKALLAYVKASQGDVPDGVRIETGDRTYSVEVST